MPPDDEAQIRQQRAQFIKSFEDIALATANLSAVAKKQIEVMNGLIDVASGVAETVMMPKDGMRDVTDELIDEIRGLREDLRIIIKSGGLQSAFSALFSGARTKK
jgi:hypothetical protein